MTTSDLSSRYYFLSTLTSLLTSLDWFCVFLHNMQESRKREIKVFILKSGYCSKHDLGQQQKQYQLIEQIFV